MDASHPPDTILEQDFHTSSFQEPLSLDVSEYEGTTSPLTPIAYHFRFTFSDQDKELKCLQDPQVIGRYKLIWRALINKLSDNQYFHLDKYTSGFEVRNKAGEYCKAHIHIAFYSNAIKQSMNRTIKRFLTEEFDQEYIGNKCYSFKEQHVRNPSEFWRYPLKQGINPQMCRGFLPEQLQQMHEVAADSYAKVCQVHQARMDKQDNSDTLFERVLNKIKKNNDTTKRSIAKTFYQHYLEENKPINRQVIEGYVLNAMLKLSIITLDDMLNSHGY